MLIMKVPFSSFNMQLAESNSAYPFASTLITMPDLSECQNLYWHQTANPLADCNCQCLSPLDQSADRHTTFVQQITRFLHSIKILLQNAPMQNARNNVHYEYKSTAGAAF